MRLVLALALAVAAHPASALKLSDGATVAVFDSTITSPTFGELTELRQDPEGQNLLAPVAAVGAGHGVPVWSLALVSGASGTTALDSRSVVAVRGAFVTSPTTAQLQWSHCSKGDIDVDVSLHLALVDGQLEYRLAVTSTAPTAGLWSWSVAPVGALALPHGSALFENAGFGLVHSPPAQFSGIYPQHTMQYMAAYSLDAQGSGVYVAAHDATAASKTFGFTPVGLRAGEAKATAAADDDAAAAAAGAQVGSFAISATPPDAGRPLSTTPFSQGWPIVVKVFQRSGGGSGGWWDASQIYRSWVLAHARWTQQGPMRSRTDIPTWMYKLTTWVNSHWQQNDIFNTSGGDPAVVANRVGAIVERFGLSNDSLALHYYEWDTRELRIGHRTTTPHHTASRRTAVTRVDECI
jgi:hypothetical protein